LAVFAETGVAVSGGVNVACGADDPPPRRFGADEHPPSPSAKTDMINAEPTVLRSLPRVRVRAEYKVVTSTSPLVQPQLPGGRHYITPRPELPRYYRN
jgi:hypothetical protein